MSPPTYKELEQRIGDLQEKVTSCQQGRASIELDEIKAIHRSNQIMAGILEHTHMMAALLDPRFNFIWVNRAYADTTRHDPSYFPGKNHFDLSPHEENKVIFQRVVNTGEPYFTTAKPFEFPNQPERGVTYWDWSLIPVKDGAGAVSNLIFTLVEVTDRVRAEEAARESEEKLRLFIEYAPAALAMFDHEMRYLAVSRRWLVDYSLEDREIIGRTHYEVFPEIPDRWREVHRQGLKGKVIRRDEDYFERADGAIQWQRWEVRPWYKGSGDIGGIVIFVEEITERKRMEEGLRKSELEFKLLTDVAGRLLATANPQGLVNELCRKLMEHLDCHVFFNFLIDERVGRLHLNAYAGIPDAEAAKIEWLDLGVAVCGCVAQEGRRMIAEDIFNTPDIRTELVKSYGIQAYACQPLMIQDKVIGTLSFGTKTRSHFLQEELSLMRTVTDQVATAMERMRLIEELRRSRDELDLRVQERTAELERKNQELQEFAFVASHDLSEPLRKIQTFGSLLETKNADRLDEQSRDYVDRMKRSANRMQELLDALLRYSRIETRGGDFKPTRLKDVVREVAGDLEVGIRKTGAQLEIGRLPIVVGDPSQLRQLFQNLLANALKYHRSEVKPIIKIHDEGTSTAALIIVEDNGIGFDEKYMDKIFQPFQRLHGKHEYSGTGIGLSICKKIVERHGGTITARSTAGKGSKFIVNLPVNQH